MFVTEETRQLARVVRIDDIKPIKKADRLELAVVAGWECVVQKGMYQKGDLAVYFEIDAAIPLDNPIWGDFDKKYLTIKKDPLDNDKEYAVIRSIRLQGVLSQGLVMQIKNLDLPGLLKAATTAAKNETDTDITRELGVKKYVTPQEWRLYQAQLAEANAAESDDRGWWWKLRMKLVKGIIVDGLLPFPRGHEKSDEDRLQNLHKRYARMVEMGDTYEVSCKLDGESATVFSDLDNNEIGIAQRNYALRTAGIPYTRKESWKVYIAAWMRFVARRLRGGACSIPQWCSGFDPMDVPLVNYMVRSGITAKVFAINNPACPRSHELHFCEGKKIAIQGEIVGPRFNGNAEGIEFTRFYIYRVYGNGSYVFPPEQARIIAQAMDIPYIPVVDEALVLPEKMGDLIKLADGPSFFLRDKLREGLVLKNNRTGQSFKIISNKWLLQFKDVEEEAVEA